jgi:hypothetical protein
LHGQKGIAEGVGPGGIEYRAAVWHGCFVFIDFADIMLKADGTPPERVPMPEPDGVVWTPVTLRQMLWEP